MFEQSRFLLDHYRPHSRGHVDAVCKEECFPDTTRNATFLGDFPTPIREPVHAELSPLAHTVHLMYRWLRLFIVNECVEVHEELRAQHQREAQLRQQHKRTRVVKAASSAQIVTLLRKLATPWRTDWVAFPPPYNLGKDIFAH